MSRLP